MHIRAILYAMLFLTVPVVCQAAGTAPVQELKIAHDDKFGAYVTDQGGKPLYILGKDKEKNGAQTQSTCFDDCARIWPPASGSPKVTDLLPADKLAVFKRKDGVSQLSFNGWPLYYYSVDMGGGGEPQGHKRTDASGTWFLVRPNGNKVE